MTAPVVVTGGSGFVGAALLAHARASGLPAIGLARHPAGDDLVRVDAYEAYIPPPGAMLVHLAEEAGLAAAGARGDRHVAETTERCAGLLRHAWGHVVYASSAAVYGDGAAHARHPAEAVRPATPYAAAKLACEAMVLARGGTALRLTNLYGPGMAPGTVLSDMLGQLAADGPLQLRDGRPVRDFLWIGDAVRGFAAAVARRVPGVFNLGSGQGVAIADLAACLLALAGQAGRPVTAGMAACGRPSCLVVDVGETAARLGWRPETPLAAGLAALLAALPAAEARP